MGESTVQGRRGKWLVVRKVGEVCVGGCGFALVGYATGFVGAREWTLVIATLLCRQRGHLGQLV